MNCKPGDLALILRGKHAGILHMVGSVVCLDRHCLEIWGYWHTTPPTVSTADGTEIVWFDGDLKPLRPSGHSDPLHIADPEEALA